MATQLSAKPRVAIIGAGWAGLAAAVELADAGIPVDVFEASRTLGGRARSVQWNGLTIDNGQHILIGAYTETLRLMRKVGADPDKLLKRIPLRLEFPGEFLMAAPNLPAPFHTAAALITAKGLDWDEKWAALRLMLKLKRNNYRIEPDVTVQQWLDANQTPSRQRRFLWEPLCVAALNTPLAEASAQILANVLRDSLGGPRAASDLLLPKVDLSSLFPEPAANFVAGHNGRIFRGRRVRLEKRDDSWTVSDTNYQSVVIAVAPHHLVTLLPQPVAELGSLVWEPIATTYLAYPEGMFLSQPMLGQEHGLAQWFFDRGATHGQSGLIAAVISTRGRHLDLPFNELAMAIHAELQTRIGKLPMPTATRTIVERRATFASAPELRRPPSRLPFTGLHLAGDYVAGEYPATLEAAVRCGVGVAATLRAELAL